MDDVYIAKFVFPSYGGLTFQADVPILVDCQLSLATRALILLHPGDLCNHITAFTVLPPFIRSSLFEVFIIFPVKGMCLTLKVEIFSRKSIYVSKLFPYFPILYRSIAQNSCLNFSVCQSFPFLFSTFLKS